MPRRQQDRRRALRRLQRLDQSTEPHCYRLLARLSRSRPTPTSLVSPDGQPSSNFVDPKTGACTNRVEGFCPCSNAGYANATASPEQENARPLHGRVPMATRTKIPSKHRSRPSGGARVLGRQRPEILTSSIIKLLSTPTSCTYEVPPENAVQWCVPCLLSSAASHFDVCLCGVRPGHRA